MIKFEKPKRGINPKFIHDLERLSELRDYINRFVSYGYKLSLDTVCEYNDLIERSKECSQ